VPGLASWGEDEVIAFGAPNLTFEPGGTNGTFSSIVKLEDLGDGDVSLDALHYVTTTITVGSANSVNLLAGDLLFSTQDDETMTSLNSVSFNDEDIIVFRPQATGDYSAGTFIFLLDMDGVTGDDIDGISLVENDTVVGDVILQAGTFLRSGGPDKKIYHFTADNVGPGTTNGTDSLLIDGGEINFDKNIWGIELVENTVSIGGTVLSSGTILMTLDKDDNDVGNNSIVTKMQDIFYLTVTTTKNGPMGTTAANATLFLDGSDVGLDTGVENLNGLTLVGDT